MLGHNPPGKAWHLRRVERGLVMGANLSQRPELFGAVVLQAAATDMTRFHLNTIMLCIAQEYGSPDRAEDFPILYAYSPYHRVRSGTHYPATMPMTGAKDDRMMPIHAYKLAAALQAAQGAPEHILLRIIEETGHSYARPASKTAEIWTNVYGFLMSELAVPFEPAGRPT